MGKMTVYHGGYTVIQKPKIIAKFKYPTHQISFCTDAALKCLEFVSSEGVGI